MPALDPDTERECGHNPRPHHSPRCIDPLTIWCSSPSPDRTFCTSLTLTWTCIACTEHAPAPSIACDGGHQAPVFLQFGLFVCVSTGPFLRMRFLSAFPPTAARLPSAAGVHLRPSPSILAELTWMCASELCNDGSRAQKQPQPVGSLRTAVGYPLSATFRVADARGLFFTVTEPPVATSRAGWLVPVFRPVHVPLRLPMTGNGRLWGGCAVRMC